MSQESKRFARIVLARFKELGFEHDDEIADAGGPSSTTMTNVRKAERDAAYTLPRPRRDSAKRYDRAARWEVGSARRVYDGGEPTPILPGVSPEESRQLDVLRTHIAESAAIDDRTRAELLRVLGDRGAS